MIPDFIKIYFHFIFPTLIGYYICYYGLPLWLILIGGLIIIKCDLFNFRDIYNRYEILMESNENDRAKILRRQEQLRTESSLFDGDTTVWINKVLKYLWPKMKDDLEGKFIGLLGNYGNLHHFDLGEKPPNIISIKHCESQSTEEELILDLILDYEHPGRVTQMSPNKLTIIKGGIHKLNVRASVRIKISDFQAKSPYLGKIYWCFLDMPMITYELNGAIVILNWNYAKEEIFKRFIKSQIYPNWMLISDFINNIIPVNEEMQLETQVDNDTNDCFLLESYFTYIPIITPMITLIAIYNTYKFIKKRKLIKENQHDHI